MREPIEDIHEQVWKLVDDSLGNGIDVTAVAAVLCTTSLVLYRSSMPEEDYNRMVDSISEQRGRVAIIERPVLN